MKTKITSFLGSFVLATLLFLMGLVVSIEYYFKEVLYSGIIILIHKPVSIIFGILALLSGIISVYLFFYCITHPNVEHKKETFTN